MRLRIKFQQSNQCFKLKFGELYIAPGDSGNGEVPNYIGDYIVTPKAFESTTLLTKEKKMLDNVKVKEIPYFEVSNAGNGVTVTIGEI